MNKTKYFDQENAIMSNQGHTRQAKQGPQGARFSLFEFGTIFVHRHFLFPF